MKKLISSLIIVLFCVNIINAQNNKINDDIIFKFKNQEDISKNFVDRTNDKFVDFEIIGIDTKQKAQNLQKKISEYRGVKEFTIEKNNNKYMGHLHLYEYADHWMYYKFLFKKNGIKTIMFGNQIIECEKLSEL